MTNCLWGTGKYYYLRYLHRIANIIAGEYKIISISYYLFVPFVFYTIFISSTFSGLFKEFVENTPIINFCVSRLLFTVFFILCLSFIYFANKTEFSFSSVVSCLINKLFFIINHAILALVGFFIEPPFTWGSNFKEGYFLLTAGTLIILYVFYTKIILMAQNRPSCVKRFLIINTHYYISVLSFGVWPILGLSIDFSSSIIIITVTILIQNALYIVINNNNAYSFAVVCTNLLYAAALIYFFLYYGQSPLNLLLETALQNDLLLNSSYINTYNYIYFRGLLSCFLGTGSHECRTISNKYLTSASGGSANYAASAVGCHNIKLLWRPVSISAIYADLDMCKTNYEMWSKAHKMLDVYGEQILKNHPIVVFVGKEYYYCLRLTSNDEVSKYARSKLRIEEGATKYTDDSCPTICVSTEEGRIWIEDGKQYVVNDLFVVKVDSDAGRYLRKSEAITNHQSKIFVEKHEERFREMLEEIVNNSRASENKSNLVYWN